MEFFYVVRATQKSGKPDAVVWFTAKSEARANLQLDVALEDAGIETGRGQDYNKPCRTDFPVVDDLPEEGEIDLAWCEHYELQDDGRTWLPKSKQGPKAQPETTTETVVENGLEISKHDGANTTYGVAQLPFRKQLLAQFTSDAVRHQITRAENAEIAALEMDTDNSYVQNLLLAAENCDELKKLDLANLWKYTDAIKKVFASDKRHELSLVLQFTKIWLTTEYIDRGILVKEWAAGNRISTVQSTEAGANAGGGNKTDRNPDYEHTLDTLDQEIALATLPMDFDIYNIPISIHRRAKEIISAKESPFKEWSAALRKTPGVLDYSRAAIFALIRGAAENVHHFPVSLQTYINANLTESKHDTPSAETVAIAQNIAGSGGEPSDEVISHDEMSRQLAAGRGEFVPGVSDPSDPKWVHEDLGKSKQPEIANVGNGIFSIDGLMAAEPKPEDTSNEQMEEAVDTESATDNAVSAGEGADEADPQADTVTTENTSSEILAAAAPNLAKAAQEDAAPEESIAETDSISTEEAIEDAAPAWPDYFEPGRYEGVRNEVYHAANGISSTQVKDARVSLMYFNALHVAKTIVKERSAVLDMGNLVHALALQPESLEKEFSVEPEIPEGAFTTTATIRDFIDEHNASLPPLLSADDIKALLEEHNATLPAQVPLGASAEETGQSYMALPAEFQRIEEGQKQTASAMKACIKEYNATLPAQVKTSGSRDALLEQLALINPDLVAQEAQKAQPLKVSGTKSDLMQVVKSINPDAVFADELLDAWRDNPDGKVLVTRQQLSTALAIQKALLDHPTAGKLLAHPSRAVEVSYFGFDEETGLEVRVRPDLEIDMGGLRIGADLKTISMWNVKQEGLRGRLHREIIDRDYHLSAAMYCETAALDQFFWIFVNKDEHYHWIAIIEASAELLELGMLEYRKAMRAIADGFDTGHWPAPITEDYAEELNDFDVRRLEALRVQA
ncbi:PD-(D/E)XK nuclease-like domain-containing protein [Pluralibacter gergoviae]|nr:PD-(D/E)XK nuclease-like domain-containing protein [Pluralibacter gergoviae]ELC3015620.1 PD-(D/E)XK nuclease-like domain-containing protein [Pluralibacter gergoviae]ELC3020599.1 PD-(D/E)XK nuclease-like domain-containing protein [Pluralibacter gergoviae]